MIYRKIENRTYYQPINHEGESLHATASLGGTLISIPAIY